jgi:leucyl aminopeptidase
MTPNSLAPHDTLPRIRFARALREADASRYDALILCVAARASAAEFARSAATLPDASRWRELHARHPATANTVRSSTLANRTHTQIVIAYAAEQAAPFQWQSLAARAIKEVSAREPTRIVLVVALSGADERTDRAAREAFMLAALAAAYRAPSFRAKRSRRAPLAEVVVVGGRIDTQQLEAGVRSNARTRWLTTLPPNKLDARAYRKLAVELAREHRLAARWYDERALRRLGAGAFLAVAAGNASRDAGILQLKYRPRGATRPDVALVGKGIIFDTGGTNLKPHRSMLEMHTDMSGSAVALATLLALAELRAPFAVDCWLAITENRIGPTAYKPQDIVTACNGTTIQIVHTDAEGRMVLADTLALASRARPRAIIDFATLTGAAVYALTERMSAVMTNREHLHGRLLAAGQASGERVWPFPLEEDYDSDIESKIADVMQCSADGKGDQILAARFLQRFVATDCAWVHVDLASVQRHGGLGAISTDITGFGPRFAIELLLGQKLLAHLRP